MQCVSGSLSSPSESVCLTVCVCLAAVRTCWARRRTAACHGASSDCLSDRVRLFGSGKNLLGQKTELQRAMERHRDQQQRRQQQARPTSFELVMEQRLSRAEPRVSSSTPAPRLSFWYSLYYCGSSLIFLINAIASNEFHSYHRGTFRLL